MAWAHVQSTSVANTTPAGSNNLSYGSNVTAGNLLVVVAATYVATGSQVVPNGGVTDSQGNTYTRQTNADGITDAGGSLSVHTALAGSTGACTVTVNATGSSDYHSISIHEFSGISSATPEAVNSQRNAAATSAPSPSISSSSANALIFGAMSYTGAVTTISTAATGYTQRTEGEDGASYMPFNTGDKDGGAAGSQTATWTLGAARESLCAILALTPTGGGGGGSGIPFFIQDDLLSGGLQTLHGNLQ